MTRPLPPANQAFRSLSAREWKTPSSALHGDEGGVRKDGIARAG